MSSSRDRGPGADRNEGRSRDLRETIAAVARDLILEQGLDAVTVDQIARAANVSRRTFFNYFPSKAAACVPEVVPADREAVELFLSDRSVSTMTALARLLWHQVASARRRGRDFDRFHEMWRREPGIRSEVNAVLARTEHQLARLVARREGRTPGSVEAAAAAAASIAVMRVAVERWRTDEPGTLLEHRIREAFDTIDGLVSPPSNRVPPSDRVPPRGPTTHTRVIPPPRSVLPPDSGEAIGPGQAT